MNQTDGQSHPTAAGETARETDAKWLTFRELAAAHGISKASAQSLIRRHGWRRQTDNQGRVKALVPLIWIEREPEDQSGGETVDQSDRQTDTRLMARGLAALEDAVAGLRAQLERADRRGDDERQRADDLRAQIEVLTAELLTAKDAAERAHAEARAATETADRLQGQADQWQAMGTWARLRAAWRGR
jgi:hypothetical protein